MCPVLGCELWNWTRVLVPPEPHTGPPTPSPPEPALTLVSGDGQHKEGAEGGNGDSREEDAHEEKATQPLEPGPPVILHVHHVCDQDPQRQHTCRADVVRGAHSSSPLPASSQGPRGPPDLFA